MSTFRYDGASKVNAFSYLDVSFATSDKFLKVSKHFRSKGSLAISFARSLLTKIEILLLGNKKFILLLFLLAERIPVKFYTIIMNLLRNFYRLICQARCR